MTLCKSGAILKYLAESTASSIRAIRSPAPGSTSGCSTALRPLRRWPSSLVIGWCGFSLKVPQAQEHYTANLRDVLGILDRHLAANEYFGGDYSIADMTMYGDVHLHGGKDIGLNDYPNVERWHDAMAARPSHSARMGTVSNVTHNSGLRMLGLAGQRQPGRATVEGCATDNEARYGKAKR